MFVIYDNKAKEPYVFVAWPNKEIAGSEMWTLLKGFPDNHEWRKRLSIKPVDINIQRFLENHQRTKKADRVP